MPVTRKVFLFVLLLLSKNSFAQSWIPLGASDSNKPSVTVAERCAMTLLQDAPAILFGDQSQSGRTIVRHLTATGWKQVGAGPVSAGICVSQDLVASHDTLYAIIADNVDGQRATVRRWAGGVWTSLGSAPLSVGHASDCRIALLSNGTPVAACIDSAQERKVVVRKWDGASWQPFGTSPLATSVHTGTISLAIGANDLPILAYTNSQTTGDVSVLTFSGSNWASLGNSNLGLTLASALDLAVRPDGKPFLRAHTGNQCVVFSLNGTVWDGVGSALQDNGYHGGSIAFDAAGTLYHLFEGSTNALQNLLLQRFDPLNGWITERDFGPLYLSTVQLAVASNGAVYLGGSAPSQAAVYRYQNGAASLLAAQGLSTTPVEHAAVALDSNGTPYVVFSDDAHGKKATVRKYESGMWQVVGDTLVSDSTVLTLSIAIGKNNLPVVAFSQYASQPKVRRLVGNTWQTIGNILQLPDGVGNIDMCLDTNDNPVIACLTGGFSRFPAVLYYDTAWHRLGGTNVSTDPVYEAKIAVNRYNQVYVASSRQLGYTDIAVHTFANGSWQHVGPVNTVSPNASSGGFLDIATDTNGVPYVMMTTSAVLVSRYANGWWETMPVVAQGMSFYNSISIDASTNIPYVAYSQSGGNLSTIVRRFRTNFWEAPGNAAISNGTSYNAGVAVRNGKAVGIYSNTGLFAKSFQDSVSLPPQSLLPAPGLPRKTGFTLFPNPAASAIVISSLVKPAGGVEVSVTDGAGREVYRGGFLDRLTISTWNWIPGIYQVRLTTSGGAETLRFIKR